MYSPFFIVMWIVSAAFSVLFAAALGAYVLQSWKKLRGPAELPAESEILDRLDQIQAQLYSMSERMQRVEGHLTLPPGQGRDAEPGGEDA